MKPIQRLFIAFVCFGGIASTIVKAQNLPPNFGTPQGTDALAASAGFLDIFGIKLGMPAEQAVATLKANYPGSKIRLTRSGDYESAWYQIERENPNHKWVYAIDVDSIDASEKMSVGLSVPPSKQVVHSISQEILLKEPVALENIIISLRKKYGQETYGVDYRMSGLLAIFDGPTKHLLWVYDPQGNRMKPDAVTKNAQTCAAVLTGDVGAPQFSPGSRAYERETLHNNPCMPFVFLHAWIQMVSPTQGISGQVNYFGVSAYDYPLITSGANALYAFLDQGARDVAAKQAADAKKRGGDLKY